MVLYTSRYQNPALRDPSIAKVRITLGAPRWKLGYALADSIRELAPSRAMFHLNDRAEFEPLYCAKLDQVGVE